MSKPWTRRQFIETQAAAGIATSLGLAAGGQARRPAGERVRLGVIGTGNRGTQVARAFLTHADVEIAGICDVYEPYLQKFAADLQLDCPQTGDFRRLLDRDDIDAVLIATPDHWHAIQTIQACRAGKDVYVEKPLSVTIHEGRRMVEVARETQRVVQVGTHRRSSAIWQQAIELIRSGALGKVTMLQAYRLNNMFPSGIGKRSPEPVPAGLDWDMWLGPREYRPYQDNITPYKFRWWLDYSSQMGNWGVHYLDAMRWVLDETAPRSICAIGGQYAIEDDRTIPDTAQAVYEFSCGALGLFGTYEAFSTPMLQSGEFEVRGTSGMLSMESGGIRITAEKRGQFQSADPPGESQFIPLPSGNHDDTVAHTRNFLDCIRSRQRPNADVEIGHRSTTLSLLANLSLATRQRLEWDAESERFVQPQLANDLLHYEYRQPWTLD